ncbi:hypothetical protein BT96DRAFT_989516 [Gymnopus androsaceus JB14]|uniref:Uncharacterized protein n=1 Tax=Gymnopus androsaceus JB14 TaxID=1447944 RepID=A0A6A4I2Q2_9AGAR|nr:hypothetical protein BT96DRAFT_989516 [Gymnopus androsaceus JB14]
MSAPRNRAMSLSFLLNPMSSNHESEESEEQHKSSASETLVDDLASPSSPTNDATFEVPTELIGPQPPLHPQTKSENQILAEFIGSYIFSLLDAPDFQLTDEVQTEYQDLIYTTIYRTTYSQQAVLSAVLFLHRIFPEGIPYSGPGGPNCIEMLFRLFLLALRLGAAWFEDGTIKMQFWALSMDVAPKDVRPSYIKNDHIANFLAMVERLYDPNFPPSESMSWKLDEPREFITTQDVDDRALSEHAIIDPNGRCSEIRIVRLMGQGREILPPLPPSPSTSEPLLPHPPRLPSFPLSPIVKVEEVEPILVWPSSPAQHHSNVEAEAELPYSSPEIEALQPQTQVEATSEASTAVRFNIRRSGTECDFATVTANSSPKACSGQHSLATKLSTPSNPQMNIIHPYSISLCCWCDSKTNASSANFSNDLSAAGSLLKCHYVTANQDQPSREKLVEDVSRTASAAGPSSDDRAVTGFFASGAGDCSAGSNQNQSKAIEELFKNISIDNAQQQGRLERQQEAREEVRDTELSEVDGEQSVLSHSSPVDASESALSSQGRYSALLSLSPLSSSASSRAPSVEVDSELGAELEVETEYDELEPELDDLDYDDGHTSDSDYQDDSNADSESESEGFFFPFSYPSSRRSSLASSRAPSIEVDVESSPELELETGHYDDDELKPEHDDDHDSDFDSQDDASADSESESEEHFCPSSPPRCSISDFYDVETGKWVTGSANFDDFESESDTELSSYAIEASQGSLEDLLASAPTYDIEDESHYPPYGAPRWQFPQNNSDPPRDIESVYVTFFAFAAPVIP